VRKTKNSASTNKQSRKRILNKRYGKLANPKARKTNNDVAYEDALEFVQGFVHYHVDLLHSLSDDFKRERYNLCAKEIVCDIFKEKYNLPPFEAAVLMLHFGIEMLILQDVKERNLPDFIKDIIE
jgi:hypothetical protein